MLLHPLLWQGLVALKALFILTADPARTQSTGSFGRRNIGNIALTMALVATPSLIIYNRPEEPPQLYELMLPPPMDLIVWEPVTKICLDLSLVLPLVHDTAHGQMAEDDLDAGLVPPSNSGAAAFPAPSQIVASPLEHFRVPELDWAVPGAPSLKARKLKKEATVRVDLYFIAFSWDPNLRKLSLADVKQRTSIPSDDPPSIWQYELSEITFIRLCMKKGPLPLAGESQVAALLTVRFFVLYFVIWVLLEDLRPIPRLVRRAWRAYRRSKRPPRRNRRRHPHNDIQ